MYQPRNAQKQSGEAGLRSAAACLGQRQACSDAHLPQQQKSPLASFHCIPPPAACPHAAQRHPLSPPPWLWPPPLHLHASEVAERKRGHPSVTCMAPIFPAGRQHAYAHKGRVMRLTERITVMPAAWKSFPHIVPVQSISKASRRGRTAVTVVLRTGPDKCWTCRPDESVIHAEAVYSLHPSRPHVCQHPTPASTTACCHLFGKPW